MPGERELHGGREDADPRVPVGRRRVDEDGLRQVQFARERLQLLLGQVTRVGEHRNLVPGERRIGEDVRDDVAKRGHPATLVTGCRAKRQPAGVGAVVGRSSFTRIGRRM
jgi:hypothetical protein